METAHKSDCGVKIETAGRGYGGASVTHLDKQWHYAAGIHHPARTRPHDGLSLVPPRSALWMNARGERIGPVPLVPYADTRWLVEQVLRQPGQYSWQVMNWKIAIRELAVSGCDFMTAFRYKRRGLMLRNLLLGDRELVRRLLAECGEDVVSAGSLPELADKIREISILLAYEATADLGVKPKDVETPMGTAHCAELTDTIGLVPVLRAGLGMVYAFPPGRRR